MNAGNNKRRNLFPSIVSSVLVIGIGAVPQARMHDPIPFLAERFVPGAGWVELLLLALYAGWLAAKLISASPTTPIRRNVWLAFSCIFFLQALLGIAGIRRFLMTGTLHLPVPAMIIAGPLYRGEVSLFMPVLLSVTVLVAGPAWCSWFCYFGSWDFLAARHRSRTVTPIRHPFLIRTGILLLLVAGALFLRNAGLPAESAVFLGILFGAAGICSMIFLSRNRGVLVHCTGYCPIGLITTVAGKINPFRIRIDSACTECRLCKQSCRYGALTDASIARRTPGLTCTLCGDCLASCPGGYITYRFPGVSPKAARSVFTVIVVVVHTLFIGFGRI